MNRGGAFQNPSSLHKLIGEGGGRAASLWSLDNLRSVAPTTALHHHPQQTFPLLPPSSSASPTPSSSSSSSVFSQYPQPPSNLQTMALWHDNQELPESWSQLLLGGLGEEEDRCSFTPFPIKKMENWEDQVMFPPVGAAGARVNILDNIKNELSMQKVYNTCGQGRQELQIPRSSWSQILPNSSPTSCVTTSFNSSMLDFSNNSKPEVRHQNLDNSSQECNSTATCSPYKKARVQASSAQSTFKVRKEKLGDRITALHQLVSPFGKTDTASVLFEAIGYIRFLQSQIEALSSPYLATAASPNLKQQLPAQGERSYVFPEDPGQLLNENCLKKRVALDQDGSVDHEPKKDLRSRGLCLVPVSFTLHVGSDNGADYWAPAFGGGFR